MKALSLIVAMLIGGAAVTSGAANAGYPLRPSERIPLAPEGYLWKVDQFIENPAMQLSFPGIAPRYSGVMGPYFILELEQATVEQAGNRLNIMEVGAYLEGSDDFFERELVLDNEGYKVVTTDKRPINPLVTFTGMGCGAQLTPEELKEIESTPDFFPGKMN
ncbi:MAG TPA: hypothetical protein PKC28_12415 [Bdellovibrionales bacterium]|nr:hypothetical protein [Bdellovibrionales bacterium]